MMTLIAPLMLMMRFGCCTPSCVWCGVGRGESVKRVHGWRRRVALDIVSVVHAEVRSLCAGARPRRDRWQERVVVDSVSECLHWGRQAVGRGEG